MDVNLTISLMRGQMGVVIEKAVNAAVETVLGEMIRVVSLKFEQLRREMSLKDKENHDIKKMLETSRCQMKILRQKYITALNAKDYRQPLLPQGSVPAAQPPGLRRVPAPSDSTAAPGLSAPGLTAPGLTAPGLTAPRPAPKVHTGSQQESVPAAEICTPSAAHSNQDLQRAKSHGGLKVETSSLPGTCEPHWAQKSQAPTEAEHTDTLDLNLLPVVHTNEVLNTTVADGSDCLIKVKQEEPEVEIFEVKQELVEPSTSESSRMELHHQVAGSRNSIELPGTYQSGQTPGPSVTEPPAFLGMDQSAYSESQLAVADAQGHSHPYCKDLTLYEDYKRKRSEVRKRSETRRRELEQTLPQALLADLVKERREKTRLRVARWRAKRKLQACLMAQAAQFNGTQAIYTQRNVRRGGGAAPEQGGISMGTVQTESGMYSMPLQVGNNPLLAAQRLGMAEGQLQPGPTAFLQQRTSNTGAESYQ